MMNGDEQNLHQSPNNTNWSIGDSPNGSSSVTGWIRWALIEPLSAVANRLPSRNSSIYKLLFGSSGNDTSTGQIIPTEMQGFARRYEKKYGKIHPVFYDGTYQQALDFAKKNLQFLLVYLHSHSNSNADKLCKEVLCKQTVVDFIDSNMVFWAQSTSALEGHNVLVLRENRMEVVARIEGILPAQELVVRLGRILDENHRWLALLQAEREQLAMNQLIRRQQDEAYELSLQTDREKAKLKEAEQEQEAAAAREKQELVERERKRREDLQRFKEEAKSQLLAEPAADHPDTVRVIVKLPNGVRLDRRFLRNSSTKHLFFFILLHEAAPDNFDVVQHFPRRVLPCNPRGASVTDPPTFAAVGFGKSELVFVHDVDA